MGSIRDAIEYLEARGFDVQTGIANCAGEENYMDILDCLYEEGKEKLAEMKEYIAQKNTKNYAIAIHGMKSVMMTIGAGAITEIALGLNKRAASGEFDGIWDDATAFCDVYEKMLSNIGTALKM